MEKRIALNPYQISLLRRYAKEREEAMQKESDLIQFIVSIENVDPGKVLRTDIVGSDFVIVINET